MLKQLLDLRRVFFATKRRNSVPCHRNDNDDEEEEEEEEEEEVSCRCRFNLLPLRHSSDCLRPSCFCGGGGGSGGGARTRGKGDS